MGTPKPVLIRLKGICKRYPLQTGGSISVLNSVRLDILEGEFLTIIGSSGCGKTTLLEILSGVLKPTEGEILVKGKSIQGINSDTAIVFQDYALFPWLTVYGNVEFGLQARNLEDGERRTKVIKYLNLTKLKKYQDFYPNQLSGGMKQRVALARALALETDVLLMDEPFSSVDAQTRQLLQLELLKIFEKTKMTIVFVTHSVDEAIFMSDRIIVMDKKSSGIKSEFKTKIKRPRRLAAFSDKRFQFLRRRLWAEIKSEIGK